MNQVFQIGAGNIGRGFIARLFYNNDYNIVFSDVNQEIIDLINKDNQYTVFVVDQNKSQQEIKNVYAINSNDQNSFNKEFQKSSVITISVGASILQFVAKNIVAAINYKMAINDHNLQTIIACENYVGASSYLKELVTTLCTKEQEKFMNETITFPDCAVDCIVPPSEASGVNVSVESFYELVLDKTKVTDQRLCALKDITFTNQINAFIERKLFTLNAGHALISYCGFKMGFTTVFDAISNPIIYKKTYELMCANGKVLCARHQFDEENHQAYIDKILTRFKNPHLGDELVRVARGMLRKTKYGERLATPLLYAKELGFDYQIQLEAIVAAFTYSNFTDTDVISFKKFSDEFGQSDVIKFVTKFDDEIVSEIDKAINKQKKEGI